MRQLVAIALALVGFAAGAAELGELDVARQALRDGLWRVARKHAANDGGEMAKLVILESYANEDKWDEVKKSLATWGDGLKSPGFNYYRAVVAGDLDKAAKLLKASGSVLGVAESKMLAADLAIKKGNRPAAEKLWGEVAAMTNASERAYAIACINLGDIAKLKGVCEKVSRKELRLMASARLGLEMLRQAELEKDGEQLIRAVVRESPDTVGAIEAFLAIAEIARSKGDSKAAIAIYRDAIEIWPKVTKRASVQLGMGEALLKYDRWEEAASAFAAALECAEDDNTRALAIAKRGDALFAMGRQDEAMAEYRRAIEKFPKSPVVASLRKIVRVRELDEQGRKLYGEYKYVEAGKVFAEIGKIESSQKERMDYLQALCLYGRGRDNEARAAITAIANDSGDATIVAEARLWLAKYAFNLGEWKTAIARFNDFAENVPDNPVAPNALLWSTMASFSANDYAGAIQTASKVAEKYRDSPAAFAALLIQGESLIELARYDEAALVLDQVMRSDKLAKKDRFRAEILRADALFAMGADNPARYEAALEAFRAVQLRGGNDDSAKLTVAYKIGKALEKLKRHEESVDQYYTQVVLAYRDGRARGVAYDDEAKAAFSRAAFRLAEEFESRGRDAQAVNILRLLANGDTPSSSEAQKRIDRISMKGRFL